MHGALAPPAKKSGRFSVIGFGAAAIAALALSLGAYLTIGYQTEIASAQQTTEKLARALDVHTRAVLTAVDGVLQSAMRELSHAEGFGHTDPSSIHDVLKMAVASQGTIGSLWVLDKDGRVIATSIAPSTPPLQFGTRSGFQAHRLGNVPEPIIGLPMTNPLNGKQGLTVSRRLTAPNGEFVGVLVAGIPTDLFSDFFRSLQVGVHGSVAMTRNDGIILARDPGDGMIGQSLAEAPLFRDELAKSPAGTYRTTTILDTTDRIISYRAIPQYSVVVSIGTAVDDALAEWYRDLRTYIAIWLAFAAMLAFFTVVMMRQASRREAAEEIAHEGERRFQHFVSNVPGCVFQRVMKPDGSLGYNFISAYVEDLFGLTAEEVVQDGAKLINAVHPDHRKEFHAELQKSARELTPFSLEVVSVRSDGHQRWVHTVSIPERRSTGEIVWDGVMLDITARKQAEAALREGEHRFQRLVANVPGCVYQRVQLPDGQLRFNYFSPQIEGLYGVSAEAVMRDSATIYARIPEGDREHLLEAIHRSARTLEPVSLEHRVQHPDGSIRWVQSLSSPYRLRDGSVVWDGLVIDITDRKKAELALQESSAEASRMRALLTDAIGSLNDGFVLYDKEDRLILMNPVARDWSPEVAKVAVPGVKFEDIVRAAIKTGHVHGDVADPETLLQQRVARHRQAFGTVIERQIGDRWYHVREHPTGEGGVVVLRTDVTELKQANIRLARAMVLAQEASRAKSDFLAMMSHELRTPLNVVIGFAEILRKHGTQITTEKIVDYAGDVYEAATHLLNLINDVLDLSKAEAGKMDLQRAAVDVPDIVRRSMRMIQERALRRGVTLVDQIENGLPIIWADERKLMQILLNLLSNAVKFTPQGGKVTVAVRRADDDALAIDVTDTGIGIAPEHIDTALTAFGQIDNNLTRQQPGTGLGLPLAKRLTELHGATFDLRSQVGVGTTVSLRFPVVRAWSTVGA